MLKFKKILPIVCATAVIFAGCGSDAPAADNSAGAEPGSVVEENIDEPLSVEEEVPDEEEDTQQTDGQDEEAVEEHTAAGSENSTKASGSESKAEASKSSAAKTETKAAAKTETKTSSKSNASTNTASSGSTASSSAAPAAAKPAEPTYKYKDGTYSGSAQGFNGPVGVSVTVSKDKITAVSVTSSTDDEPYISNAKALCSHMVSANSADVSGVSGATYSSNGIKGAVKAALAKAKN